MAKQIKKSAPVMLKKDSTNLVWKTFMNVLNDNFITEYGTTGFHCDVGTKFIKVWSRLSNGQDSCYCFVERETGDIYKSASYRAPAKHARGNIFDGFNNDRLYGVGEYGANYLR